jgi:multidrug efflux system outer membrane protein
VKKVGILFFGLFFAGCVVGPNYRRPALDIPNSYRYEVNDPKESLEISWWKEFQDPVIDCLVEQALANNKDIKIAAANIEQAAGFLIQTRSQLFPQIGYNASGMRQRLSETTATPIPPTIPNPQTLYQALGTASWEIDLWGRIRRLTQSAKAELFATVEARRGVILTLVASVVNTYLELRGLDAQLIISKRTQRSYAEAVDYFELQFEHGQVSQMTVASAKTQYETATAAIFQIEQQIALTENGLSVLLGRNPGPIERGKLIGELTLPHVPSGIPSEILEQRPDIMQAEYFLMAANAQIGAAKALYFPSISLTGVYGGASQELNKLFTGPSRTWTYTGTVTGPIFTFGAIYGQVIQTKAATEAALYSYELAIQQAFADVENALASRLLLTEQLEARNRLVEAAGEYAHLSKLQYDGGYAPYFVVIQAQTQLFPAELSRIQTLVLVLSSLVNIYQALGGGWVFTAEQMTCY